MRRILIILTLCVGCITAADAQSTFTQRLEKSNAGEGKVTVTQDKEIEKLVNGTVPTISTPTQKKPVQNVTSQKEQDKKSDKQTDKQPDKLITADVSQETIAAPDTTETQKKVLKGYKVNGYRVQVFAGGNSRDAKQKAERTGSEIKSLFPGVPVYVHFYSPRWICRMGNYRTYEEAHEVLRNVKQLGYDSAIIVKGKITVPYP